MSDRDLPSDIPPLPPEILSAEPEPVPLAARLNAVAPTIIGFVVVIGFISLTAAVLFRSIPESTIVSMMLGGLSAGFTMVLGFYFGSNASSRGKDVAIGTLVADAAAARRP